MTFPTEPDTSLTERRQKPRARVKLASHLRERGRTAVEACVSDLSETGCKVECLLVPFPGNTVWVRLPGTESLLGTVAWSHGSNAGIGFEQPLHVTTLARFANAGSFMQTAWAPATHANAPTDLARGQDMTRSEQIRHGIVDVGQSPMQTRKTSRGNTLASTIRRHVKRTAEHRAEQRFSEFDRAPGEIRLGDMPAIIVDLCSSGLRVQGEYKLTIGDTVDIVVADFAPIPGQVVWMRGLDVGISLPPGAFALN